MLDFTSALKNAYELDFGESYWLLRLYYDDESSFTGFSIKPRTVDGDVYWELISVSEVYQKGNIDDFTVSYSTLRAVIPNTPRAVEGGRFSDLFSSQKYINRKWEIYQGREDVTFSTDNKLAEGVIGADFSYNEKTFTINLNDMWQKYDIDVPTHTADKNTYSNIPEKNIGEIIPMWYGDFDTISGVPASSDFERHYVKGKVPALIVDKTDTSGFVNALADTDQDNEIKLYQLNDKNVFIYQSGYYIACDDSNVSVTTNPAIGTQNVIKFSGTDWYGLYYFGTITENGDMSYTNKSNIIDDDISTSGNIAVLGNVSATDWFDLPSNVQSVGSTIPSGSNIVILFSFGTFTGTATLIEVSGIFGEVLSESLSWGTAYQSISSSLAGSFGGEGRVLLSISTIGGGAVDVDVNEIAVQTQVEPSNTFTYQGEPFISWISGNEVIREYTVAEVDIVFVSGKGREYGSWIDADSRDNGYDEGDLIENPVYIIEDILRNELGLTSSEIDYDSFDTAGNTTDGTIGDVFNDAVSDIKFAFSVYQKTTARALIRRICKLSGLYFYWSGGKATIKARKQTYSAVDDTWDYRHIKGISFSRTPFDNVVNYITVDYDYDYGANNTKKSSTPDDNANLTDSTSIDDYGQTLKETISFNYTLDETTAENYGIAQISFLKDQKDVIDVTVTKAIYNHNEIGDAINIENFLTSLKLFGTELTSSNVFLIMGKRAGFNTCSFTLVKVPGSV